MPLSDLAPIVTMDDGFGFHGIDGGMIGPYRTWEAAAEKYWEYCAYVVFAPGCHNPRCWL